MKQLFSNKLRHEVRLLLFTKKGGQYCKETEQLLKEISAQSSNIKLDVLDLSSNTAKELKIEAAPATVICANNGSKLFYFGMPGGNQLKCLVEDIIDASEGTTDLSQNVKEKIRKIDSPLDIKVFVTPACPYSPTVVRTAHRFAIENQRIRAEMIESLEFNELNLKYGIMGVPKTVINERVDFSGTLTDDLFADKVLEACATSGA